MAARRVAGAGRRRLNVAIALVAFVLVASAVVVRRSIGAAHARDLLALNRSRAALVAERARLVGEIGTATSLSQLGPLVERRLGMHRPSDRQLVRLARPVRRDP